MSVKKKLLSAVAAFALITGSANAQQGQTPEDVWGSTKDDISSLFSEPSELFGETTDDGGLFNNDDNDNSSIFIKYETCAPGTGQSDYDAEGIEEEVNDNLEDSATAQKLIDAGLKACLTETIFSIDDYSDGTLSSISLSGAELDTKSNKQTVSVASELVNKAIRIEKPNVSKRELRSLTKQVTTQILKEIHENGNSGPLNWAKKNGIPVNLDGFNRGLNFKLK